VNGRKIEMYHSTDEQVEDFIRKGLALVDSIDPPSDLRAVVLTQAVALYSGRQIVWEQMGPMMSIPRNNG